jgi:hypothetical protein
LLLFLLFFPLKNRQVSGMESLCAFILFICDHLLLFWLVWKNRHVLGKESLLGGVI